MSFSAEPKSREAEASDLSFHLPLYIQSCGLNTENVFNYFGYSPYYETPTSDMTKPGIVYRTISSETKQIPGQPVEAEWYIVYKISYTPPDRYDLARAYYIVGTTNKGTNLSKAKNNNDMLNNEQSSSSTTSSNNSNTSTTATTTATTTISPLHSFLLSDNIPSENSKNDTALLSYHDENITRQLQPGMIFPLPDLQAVLSNHLSSLTYLTQAALGHIQEILRLESDDINSIINNNNNNNHNNNTTISQRSQGSKDPIARAFLGIPSPSSSLGIRHAQSNDTDALTFNKYTGTNYNIDRFFPAMTTPPSTANMITTTATSINSSGTNTGNITATVSSTPLT